MPKGFAALSRKKLLEISSKGGKTAHAKGTAHEWTSEEGRAAVKKAIKNRKKKKHEK